MADQLWGGEMGRWGEESGADWMLATELDIVLTSFQTGSHFIFIAILQDLGV